MTKQEVIARFCALSNEVMNRKFECREAADCFCSEAEHNLGFNFSEDIMQFIERAVEAKLPARQIRFDQLIGVNGK